MTRQTLSMLGLTLLAACSIRSYTERPPPPHEFARPGVYEFRGTYVVPHASTSGERRESHQFEGNITITEDEMVLDTREGWGCIRELDEESRTYTRVPPVRFQCGNVRLAFQTYPGPMPRGTFSVLVEQLTGERRCLGYRVDPRTRENICTQWGTAVVPRPVTKTGRLILARVGPTEARRP